MLKPSMYQIINKGDSYYEFVVAVAQRAREVADIAEKENIQLSEKPLQIAVEEFATYKVKVTDYI